MNADGNKILEWIEQRSDKLHDADCSYKLNRSTCSCGLHHILALAQQARRALPVEHPLLVAQVQEESRRLKQSLIDIREADDDHVRKGGRPMLSNTLREKLEAAVNTFAPRQPREGRGWRK